MDELEIIKRKIKLNRQGVRLCKDKIIELQIRRALIVLRDRIERSIDNKFDLRQSRKLNAIQVLLDE